MHQVMFLMQNAFTIQDETQFEKNICIEATKYHFESLGQQFRAKACLHACIKLGINYDDMLILAATSELLHNASLIHDDIQDEDDIRRGQSSLWVKFGKNIGICTGDLLLSSAYGVLSGYSNPSHLPTLIKTINQRTLTAIKGQSADILYKDNQSLSLEQYITIAKQKSGALLSLPIELALIAAEKEGYISIARNACYDFSVGYQIADDLEDIIKDNGVNGANQSVNIHFAIKPTDSEITKNEAKSICEKYLDTSIDTAQQLPNDSGNFLIELATKLKNKIRNI
jgi:geranylgeranyl pyrophosphate synthase